MANLERVKSAIKYLEIDAKEHAGRFSPTMFVSTRTMIAIAEAFRELEQRAEAAEAERSALQDGLAEAVRHKDKLAADLAELVPIRAPIEVISIIENSVNGPVYDEGVQAIWSGCIEYILRNIEEAK